MSWTTDLLSWWSSLEPLGHLVALLLSGGVGATSALLWAHRTQRRERAEFDSQRMFDQSEHQRQLVRLELETAKHTAALKRDLIQLRSQYQEQVYELERRLDHQRLFDPHLWVAAATKQRKENRDVRAVETLRAGVQRTQQALCETYLELALHHFALHAGQPSATAAAHLYEAERYAQMASLLKPDDRVASLLLEDVEAAMESQQIRADATDRTSAALVDARDSGDGYLGAAGEAEPLALELADEAAAHELAGRFVVAERLAYRARAIALQELGEDPDSTAAIRHIYARTLFGNGSYAQALEEIEAALRARSGHDQLEDPHAIALRSLRAEILGHLGRWQPALADLDALLAQSERNHGPEHHDTLELRRQHALALNALDRSDAALGEIDATLQVLDRIGEPDEPAFTCAHAARAQILHDLGRNADALTELETLLPVAERVFGVEHRNALLVRRLLALVLHALGRNEEALDDVEMLLQVQERVFGAHHPLVLQSSSLRAQILRALNRNQEALLEAQRLVPLHAGVFGDEHRETQALAKFVREAVRT